VTDNERNRKFRKELKQRLKDRTRIQKNTSKEIVKLLNTARRQINQTLAGAPTDWEQYFLPQMQKSITKALDEMSANAAAKLSTGAGDAWRAGIDLVDKPIEAGGVRLSGVLNEIDTRQLRSLRSFMTDRIKDVGLQLANKINSQLGLVAIGAQNQSDAFSNIAKLLKKGGRGRAITIVRTELGRAYSIASQQRHEQANEILPGLKKQWRRSGKIHSRPHHDTADGQVQEVKDNFNLFPKGKFKVTLLFPRDPAAPADETINCGCESLPIMYNWTVKNAGKKPFSDLELQNSQLKRDIASSAPLPKTA